MKRNIRRALAMLMAAILLLSFAGCTGAGSTNSSGQNTTPEIQTSVAIDLMKAIKPSKLAEDPDTIRKNGSKAADFAVRLFKASRTEEGENLLISPLSVLYALLRALGAGCAILTEGKEQAAFETALIDAFAAAFRLIEHTPFAQNAAHALHDLSADPASAASLLLTL